ncbi:RiPP maturation radical SAM C-methyltransferase [Kitasatospora viridis]|uniref:Ribosomal peptide maturation radical SAM protein 1 n=1 Tax=Kitasatospora viridis TaxID=281105 RepID=A0A561SFR4_9ACTN|nr:RiPP maturation radical SAM C-methyltransferase [Kitasatospora viridis]TWF73683.1 ribosomal peptide maturation radical SAM protein 1 [Kitasatospora viridis]
MRIVLVHMPWGALDMPSLALGILRAAAERAGHRVEVRYANLEYADWAAEHAGFGLADYTYFSERSYFQGAGDWVFAGALYPDAAEPDATEQGAHTDPGRYPGLDPAAEFEEYLRFLAANGASLQETELALATRATAPEFIVRLVDSIAADPPDLVGFSTTFQQNAASLAAARLLKRVAPQVRTVFGGANCDGPQGAALHRNFPFLDFVVRGEGELAFPALLDLLAEPAAGAARPAGPAGVPGLCWRDEHGVPQANPMATRPLPPAAILTPRYDGFFERLDASVAARWVEPKLVLEGSRGCWWGEKHHCTFCGLNGSSMEFRSKRPADFLHEVLSLAERHQLLDVYVVDNILDMGYFETVLRPLAELPVDLRLHFEIKANLRREQFQLLGDAGAVQVQPGIESLSSRVLKIMDKGVTGCQNVRALRDAQSAGVSVTWNYLYGFPGERPADYESVLRQLPALHHLDPPTGAGRIVIERFSPYFSRPELGFELTRPAYQYRATYRLPEGELADLAYVFTTAARGIDEALADRLTAAVDGWRARFPDSRLSYLDTGERIVLANSRPGYDWRVLELTDPVELALFRLLDQPRSPAALAARLPGGAATVASLLPHWEALGLLFHDGERWLQVAVESDNQVLMRVEHRHAPTAAEPDQAPDTGRGRHVDALG